MNTKFYLRIVSFLGFITSGIFTYLAYVPEGVDEAERILAIAMTLVCQLGSFLFLQLSLSKENKKTKLFYALLAILLFTLSIVATISYQSKRQSTIENENIAKSEQYKEAKKMNDIEQKKFEQLENSIEAGKQAIAKTSQDNAKVIESILADMNNPKTPQWRKEQVGLTLKKTQETQAETLRQMKDDLKQLQIKFENFTFTKIDDVDIKEIESKTFEQNIAALFDISETKVKTIMQIFFAVTFELTAIGSHVALKRYQDETDIFDKFKDGGKQVIARIPNIPIQNIELPKIPVPEAKKEPIPAPVNLAKVEAVAPIENNSAVLVEKNDRKFTREDLKKYIKTMYQNSKDNFSIGYKKLAELSELNEGIAKDIHKYLKEKKVVEVIGGRTKILIKE